MSTVRIGRRRSAILPTLVIVAALVLGVLEQYSGFVLGAQFQQATVVSLLIVILVFRQLSLLRYRRALQ